MPCELIDVVGENVETIGGERELDVVDEAMSLAEDPSVDLGPFR